MVFQKPLPCELFLLEVGPPGLARGAVELVIADIALEAGLFDLGAETSPVIAHMFSAVVIMAVITTLVTPVLLKRIYGGNTLPPVSGE